MRNSETATGGRSAWLQKEHISLVATSKNAMQTGCRSTSAMLPPITFSSKKESTSTLP